MDPSAAPWRAFETVDGSITAEEGGPGRAGTSPRTTTPSPAVPRPVLLGAIAAILLLAAGAVALAAGGHEASAVVVGTDSTAGASLPWAGREVVVDVGGAVIHPGVYRLPPGARIGDAIAAAGGFGPRVDAARASEQLNLAALVEDGQQVQVPARDGSRAGTSGGVGPSAGTGTGATGTLVDLNRATQAELEALPGIGPATATKIIAARESTPFRAVQDLRDRKLVGQKTFDGLTDLVTVR